MPALMGTLMIIVQLVLNRIAVATKA